MTRKCKYAFAALSFLGSAATSIYFGVSSFFPSEAPFQNTAYQVENPGKEFIRGGPEDPKWKGKHSSFSTELRDEAGIKTAFGREILEQYPYLKSWSKEDADSEGKIVRFLYDWCQKNRASKSVEIFNLIGTWCIK